jgi:hypothetical protein
LTASKTRKKVGEWWIGWIEGYGYSSVMQWMPVGNTSGFGSLTDSYHLNISGDFDGDGRDEILMYSSSDGDWWLIKINGTRGPPPSYFLKTIKIGKAIKIGNLADPFHEVIPDKFVRVTGQTPQSELLAIRYGNPTRKVWQITVTLSLVSIKQLRERF